MRRIINGVLLSLGVIFTVLSPAWFFSLVATVMIFIALLEFSEIVSKKGIFVHRYISMIIGTLIPVITYFRVESVRAYEAFLLMLLILLILLCQLIKRNEDKAVVSISVTMFTIMYVSWLFTFLIKIRLFDNGMALVGFLLLISKGGDIGAYIIGKSFGKHKLMPRISPNKTLEGAIGGGVFSIILAVCSSLFMKGFALVELIILGAVLGVVAQLGDLTESLLKRDCEVKDSAGYFVGIGGILDVIDSVIFAAPVFYLYLKIFKF